MNKLFLLGIIVAILAATSPATEYHVATNGNDRNPGTQAKPFRTIQKAADLAQPGDVVTVHQGTYRERIDPPRGGTSNENRITYQAAKGEKVTIKGSEVVKNWTKVHGDVWKATLPNSFFKGFNPYTDAIHGDWFDPRGRTHHTGAVYLNGEWLIEATRYEELTAQNPPAWLGDTGEYLLNVAWLRLGSDKIEADKFEAQQGIQTAACSEGGQCIGWANHGDWVTYKNVDFGKNATEVEIRAASVTEGGVIELHLDTPEGKLLGKCTVTNTGDWQIWKSFTAKIKPTSGTRTLCLFFKNNRNTTPKSQPLWFSKVDEKNTTIWAQFPGVNPNEQLVEINVRQTVFYPSKTGRNYITIRGFTMQQAATPWAPPTAEQIGLIGTNWSKGWIIENNRVSHSICSGIALGKHGDKFDNTSADTAEGYVKTIERALANGWTMENIGGHIVRNNEISFCEQTGVLGSLGAIHSLVEGNEIHDIHVRGLFSGAEMAGIKFHGAIDTVIRRNHIYRTCLGIWLDWMAQGTRVTQNLFHDNASQDLFVEVNHGPFVVDNNLFLSGGCLLDVSEGGAYVHNLFAGTLVGFPDLGRQTPWHKPHSTVLGGLTNVGGGDDRFYNNLFVGRGAMGGSNGLSAYADRQHPLFTGWNVFYGGAKMHDALHDGVTSETKPVVRLTTQGKRIYLEVSLDALPSTLRCPQITTLLLGKTLIAGLPYENADGSPLLVDMDYFGKKREKVVAGPFAAIGKELVRLRVW